MFSKAIVISLVIAYLYLAVPEPVRGQSGGYAIKQITVGSFDHKSPSINNAGDIVWSQQAGGFWQIYILFSGTTTPVRIPGQASDHNNQFPDIDDAGDVLYLKDGVGAGPGLVVVKNTGGVETTVEFSSGNPPGCTEPPAGPGTCTSYRSAGQHSGIASSGTTITYHDFCSTSCTRTFDVNGSSIGTFNGYDYPDINAQQFIVYSDGVAVWQAAAGVSSTPTFIDDGNLPRLADGASPQVVYIKSSQVTSKIGAASPVFVHTGIEADLNSKGSIVFEDVVNGFSEVFLANTQQPTLTVISGDKQTGNILAQLPNPLVIKTTNPDGTAASGVPISFSVTALAGAAGFSLTNANANTALDGTASTQLTLGNLQGQYQVTASCAGGTSCSPDSVTFVETAGALILSKTGGDNQTGNVKQTVANQLTVELADQVNSPQNGVPVTFQISSTPSNSQGASLSTISTLNMVSVTTGPPTFPNGTASVPFVLGDMPGQYQITASCSGSQACMPLSVIFTETAKIVSQLQLICRPLQGPPKDILNIEARLGRHCYFLETDVDGTLHTYGAGPDNEQPSQLMGWIDGDLTAGLPNLGPDMACDGDVLGAFCTPIVAPAGESLDDIATKLRLSVAPFPVGKYELDNNSNVWAQTRINAYQLNVSLAPTAYTSVSQVCLTGPGILGGLVPIFGPIVRVLFYALYGPLPCVI